MFLLVLGWVGRVPLAFMLLTSLLKADMSESRECGRALEPPVRATSKCSAMNGVPFPFCGGGNFRTGGSEPSFIPFISPSTSSSESTAPQFAGDRNKWHKQVNPRKQKHKYTKSVTKFGEDPEKLNCDYSVLFIITMFDTSAHSWAIGTGDKINV